MGCEHGTKRIVEGSDCDPFFSHRPQERHNIVPSRSKKMTGKDFARQLIDALPDSATMDEIIHALYVNVKFSRGESEIRNGKGVSHERAKQKLEKWLK